MRDYENKTAAYLRLSRDDEDKQESDSIRNQRDLIREYVSKNKGLHLVNEYVDDGYSGTSYDRPSFQRLLDDIKHGKVNTIIVKDLSRLGRNYIETGRYLERIFPFLGVRFISILDHYDSITENNAADQIIVPFKNLINDAYARDVSTKIRSQLDVKRKNGKFIGSFAGYGYQKDPKDANHLVIDTYAAEIVRLVFRMKLKGANSQRIAEKLNEMGVLPPAAYKRHHGLQYDCGFRSGADTMWEVVTVNRILTNEMYTGTMVRRCFDAVIIDSMFRAGNDLYYGRDVLVGFFHAGIHFIIVEDDRCREELRTDCDRSYKDAQEDAERKNGLEWQNGS